MYMPLLLNSLCADGTDVRAKNIAKPLGYSICNSVSVLFCIFFFIDAILALLKIPQISQDCLLEGKAESTLRLAGIIVAFAVLFTVITKFPVFLIRWCV